jgi:hypothetical protein
MWLAYLHIQRGSYELHEIAHLTERKNHALLFCCQPPWLTLRTLTFYKPGNHHQPMNDASARIAAALQRIATALEPHPNPERCEPTLYDQVSWINDNLTEDASGALVKLLRASPTSAPQLAATNLMKPRLLIHWRLSLRGKNEARNERFGFKRADLDAILRSER